MAEREARAYPVPASFYACVISVRRENSGARGQHSFGSVVVVLFLRSLPDGGTAAGGREPRVSH